MRHFSHLHALIGAMSKEHSPNDIRLQKVLAYALPPLGIALLAWALYNSRGAYRLSAGTLSVPGHPPIALDDAAARLGTICSGGDSQTFGEGAFDEITRHLALLSGRLPCNCDRRSTAATPHRRDHLTWAGALPRLDCRLPCRCR